MLHDVAKWMKEHCLELLLLCGLVLIILGLLLREPPVVEVRVESQTVSEWEAQAEKLRVEVDLLREEICDLRYEHNIAIIAISLTFRELRAELR